MPTIKFNVDQQWKRLWETLRQAPTSVRETFIKEKHQELRVRRTDGTWAKHDQTLQPGTIVQTDDSAPENSGVLVDTATHFDDQALLRLVGVSESPAGIREPGDYRVVVDDAESKLKPWLDFVEADYRAQLDTNRRPQSGYLRPLSLSLPNGWTLLSELKGLANARMTMLFFSTLAELGETVDFGHTTQGHVYEKTNVAHPMLWYVRQYGTIAIGDIAIPISTILARRDRPVLAKMRNWNSVVSKFDGLVKLVGAPELPTPSTEKIASLWQALFLHLATPETIASDNLQDLWSQAARDGQTPVSLKTHSGDHLLADIFVTGSANLASRAREKGKMNHTGYRGGLLA